METKSRPIIFSAESIRSILAGNKSETRRVINLKKIPLALAVMPGNALAEAVKYCPYGQPGDLLYCKETFMWGKGADCRESYIGTDMEVMLGDPPHYRYRATEPDERWGKMFKWRPSIFMPRVASRIILRLTDVRVQRVQDISEEDAIAEGIVQKWTCINPGTGSYAHDNDVVDDYRKLWDSINAKRGYSWDSNPWVWALTFEVAP